MEGTVAPEKSCPGPGDLTIFTVNLKVHGVLLGSSYQEQHT